MDKEGNVIWNYIYGSIDYSAGGSIAYDHKARGWDIVANGNGGYNIIGGATAPGGARKTFMMKINENGMLIWKKVLNNSINPLWESEGLAIQLDNTGQYLAVTGVEATQAHLGNNGNFIWDGKQTYVKLYPNNNAPNYSAPFWTRNISTGTLTFDEANDLDFTVNNELIVPVLALGDVYQMRSAQDGRIFLFDINTNTNILGTGNFRSIGKLDAYDLKIGVTPTADGGFAAVSSKARSMYYPFWDDWQWCGKSFWGSNAYVTKFDASFNQEWEKTFDSHDNPPAPYPADIKKQECLYKISVAPDGGYVISGNTSHNIDDSYLVKLFGDCQANYRNNNPNDFNITDDTFGGEFHEILPGSTEVWTGNKKVDTYVIVHNGAKLIIDGATVEFADSKKIGKRVKILVFQEGELEIKNGAILTSLSTCPNSMWDGIDVWGPGNNTSGPQGKVTITNSTIENAKVGILSDGGEYDDIYNHYALGTNGGGLITATNATFKNCRTSIHFSPYDFLDDSGIGYPKIKKCDFICDGPLPGSSYELGDGTPIGVNTFISMWDLHGLDIQGNTFENTGNFPVNLRGRGIVSYDASYLVSPTCDAISIPGGQCAGSENHFEGLYYGIQATESNPFNNVVIEGNEFTNNHRGIRFSGMNYATVNQNEFKVGISEFTYPTEPNSLSFQSIPYGFHTEYGEGLEVQENDVSAYFPSNTFLTRGFYLHQNASAAPFEVYKNEFHDIENGTQLSVSASSFQQQVQVKCNDYLNNLHKTNIAVTSGDIANQGQCTGDPETPAGNEFSHDCPPIFPEGDIHVGSGPGFIYSHHISPLTTPQCYDNIKVNLTPCFGSPNTGSCPSKINPGGGGTPYYAALRSEMNEFVGIVAELQALLDYGDSQHLYDMVDQNAAHGILKDSLLSASPYLSDSVMIYALTQKESPLPPGHIKQIIMANSPVTDAIMDLLNGMKIPGGIMNQINSVQTGINPRVELQNQIDYYGLQREITLSRLVRGYLNDSTINSMDSIHIVLKGEEREEHVCDAAAALVKDGELSEADQFIDSVHAGGNIDNFCKVQKQLIKWRQAGEDCFALKDDTLAEAEIRAIAADTDERGCAEARSMLTLVFGESYPEVIEPLPTGSSNKRKAGEDDKEQDDKGTVQEPLSKVKTKPEIRNYPNPFTGSTTIEVNTGNEEYNEAKVVIFTTLGRVVEELPVKQSNQKLIVSGNSLKEGMYFYSLVIDGNKVMTKRMVLIE